MKLNVIFPSYPLHPSGGHKIMYQYANLFAVHGWNVQIYHVMDVPYVTYKTPKWFRIVRGKEVSKLLLSKNSKMERSNTHTNKRRV